MSEFWTPERIAELRRMNEAYKTEKEMAEHFGRNRSAIHYAKVRLGIETARVVGVGLAARPIPDDFADIAPTMTKQACARHYGTSYTTARNWYSETGVEASKQWEKCGPKAKSKAKSKAMPYIAAGVFKSAPQPQLDPTLAGRAQRHLQRNCVVYRVSTVNPQADKDEWIVGGRRMDTYEMIAKAERQGFQRSWAA